MQWRRTVSKDGLETTNPELLKEIAESQERVKAFKESINGALNSYDKVQAPKPPEWQAKMRVLVEEFCADAKKEKE